MVVEQAGKLALGAACLRVGLLRDLVDHQGGRHVAADVRRRAAHVEDAVGAEDDADALGRDAKGDEQARDQRQRAAGDASHRHGAEHGEQQQGDLLAHREVDAKHLGNEQHDAALVERGAAHVHRGAERQHEARGAGRDLQLLGGVGQRAGQSGVAGAGREGGDEHVLDRGEIRLRRPRGPELQPQGHRAEEMNRHHAGAAEHEDPERQQDVEARLHQHAVDEAGHGVGRQPQREVHDAGHQLGDHLKRVLELPPLVVDQAGADEPDQDGKEDERQHVADAGGAVADDGGEQVSRHEHLDNHREGEAGRGLRGRDVLLGRAAVFGHETVLGGGVDVMAGFERVHHHQAEGDADGHVEKEEEERPAGQRPEFPGVAQLHDAGGQRGEHQRHDDKKQQAQEHSAERVEQHRRDPAHQLEQRAGGLDAHVGQPALEKFRDRHVRAGEQGDDTQDDADEQTAQDAVG